MHVIATAGHVDHGKSTLVRALTGMEPDRWAEERRRGMTIDLGFAWATLPSGRTLAFVDVPGHQRFIANMLAGIGPVAAVMLVVAADEGWRAQSAEHLAAANALGITHGLLVITRADLADPGPALAAARGELAKTTLADVAAVTVSGVTGAGLPELRAELDQVVAGLPEPATDARVRLWVDRAFTIRGAGTVITGTLQAGTVRVDDTLELWSARSASGSGAHRSPANGAIGGEPVQVRGLQSLGSDRDRVAAVARVAVNLRGLAKDAIGRGDALLTPGAWRMTATVDARIDTPCADLPSELTCWIGAASVPVRLRPLGVDTARLTLAHPMPLQAGDRAILSDRDRHHLPHGALILDPHPLPLRRRGAAARRATELARLGGLPTVADQVRWRGAVRSSELRAWGVGSEPAHRVSVGGDPAGAERVGSHPAEGVRRVGDWLVAEEEWARWMRDLGTAVDRRAAAAPHGPALPVSAARSASALPDAALIAPLAAAAGLHLTAAGLIRPGRLPSLGKAERGLAELEKRLRERPFDAPEQSERERLGLGRRELAIAVTLGRVLRLRDDIVLLPDAPARAARVLAQLDQPFTTSQARQALGTTRRVAIPLLEHLDRQGWTRRLDGDHRQVAPRR